MGHFLLVQAKVIVSVFMDAGPEVLMGLVTHQLNQEEAEPVFDHCHPVSWPRVLLVPPDIRT